MACWIASRHSPIWIWWCRGDGHRPGPQAGAALWRQLPWCSIPQRQIARLVIQGWTHLIWRAQEGGSLTKLDLRRRDYSDQRHRPAPERS
jgi:hypothetical protein